MNNAKMWLVVKPTVGIPLFLSAVAVGSFAVHVAVLTNTSWVGDFLKGQPLGSGEAMAAAKLPATGMDTAKAAYAIPRADGAQEILVVLPDGTVAKAVMSVPETLASADGLARPPITQ